ncbi:MAG: hypothetical protein R2695_13545 [Acidimicrobiales bacterium]
MIAIDNGSTAEQRLDAEFVAPFGPEFRFVDIRATGAPVSGVRAQPRIAEGRGEHFALMIDGAHVVTRGSSTSG